MQIKTDVGVLASGLRHPFGGRVCEENERQQFEKWYLSEFSFSKPDLSRDHCGQYLSESAMEAWAGWRARGLVRSSAQPRRCSVDDLVQLAKVEILLATRRAHELLEWRYRSALAEILKC